MTHPLAALIAGVPRYIRDGHDMVKSPNGPWLHQIEVLAALEAATPPDLVEAGKVAEDCRAAVNGEGKRAYEWTDKPHRLVYDLCSTISALITLAVTQSAQIAGMTKERDDAIEDVTNNNDWFGCCMDVWNWLQFHPNMPDITLQEGGARECVENYKTAITALIDAEAVTEAAMTTEARAMTDAPERIMVAKCHPFKEPDDLYVCHPRLQHPAAVEFVRADLSPSPEVVKELVEALRPLAALPIGNATSDDIPLYGLDGFYITHGDIRRARAVLAKLEGGE